MSPDQTANVALRVEADNPAAELFLLDPQLQLVARGIGSLQTRQAPGVYKIRVRLGRDSRDKLILLVADTVESIKAPAFASPAPIGATALTHDYLVAAAETYSAEPTISVGNGSSIFVLVRYFTPAGQALRPQGNPARGLSLVTLDGTTLVDFATQSISGHPADAWAACHVRLTPGTYLLEHETRQGHLSRAIVASPGWQTQVFLVRAQEAENTEERAGGAAPTGAFETGTVLMSRGSFESRSFDSQLTDLARIALSDERTILGTQLHELLLQKFVNPMQGIFGAHLMLLARDRAALPPRQVDAKRVAVPRSESPFDQQLFDKVVMNLRKLVGSDHPDVEALSLQSSQMALRTSGVFTVPPMLRRSWSLIVNASNDRPEILDESLWERVMARTMAAPFLSWLTSSDSTRQQFQQSIKEVVGGRVKIQESPSPLRAGRRAALNDMSESIISPEPALPDDDFQRRLSRDLDIPRRAVDKILGGQ